MCAFLRANRCLKLVRKRYIFGQFHLDLSTNIRRQSIFVQKQQVLTKKSKILVLLLDFKVLLFTEKDSNKFHTVSVVYLASVVKAVV